MFEEFARANEQEKRRELNLKPTSWSAVTRGSDGLSPSPPPSEPAFSPAPAHTDHSTAPVSKKRLGEGLLSEAGGILKSIRKFISNNEELIVLIIILFLILDCDDDLELIIALLILFYPYISKIFFHK